jgi:hypothetical protein
MTNGQLASQSWFQGPSRVQYQILVTFGGAAVFSLLNALCDKSRVCHLS